MRETTAQYYAERIRQFGPTARGVDWNSETSQILRFEQLTRLLYGVEAASVLDYGCGYGAFARYLRQQGWHGRFTGFDIVSSMIAHARAAHESDPLCTFTDQPDTLKLADFTFASGVFNVRQAHSPESWQELVLATLDAMDRLSERGFAFNMLSTYSDADRQRDDLFYGHPGFFFDWCKSRYAPRVALLHDYPLYEFTILVRK